MASKRLSLKQKEMIFKHRYILKKLANSDLRTRKIILKNSPPQLFKVLGLVFDILSNGKLDLSDAQLRHLNKHKPMMRSTSGLKGSDMKKKLIAQRGGALATILSTVLPIIGSLVKSFL